MPVPVPPTPTPIPVPVPPNPNPTPTPVPPTPTPTPVVNDFFLLGKSYKQALGKAYADAWDRNFVVAPGDDLDVKFSAIKSDWNASRTAAFSAIVAPELEKLAPNRKSVDQPTADALNKSRRFHQGPPRRELIMSVTVNVVHTFALSPGLESFIVSTIGDISTKIDDLKSSTDAKINEFIAEVQSLSNEVADLASKVVDPAELDAVAAKVDANKAAVDAVVVKPEPAPDA